VLQQNLKAIQIKRRVEVLGTFRIKKIVIYLLIFQSMTLLSCSNLKSGTVFQSQSKTPVKHGEYKVLQGDTLYSIAWRFKRDYKELAEINSIKSPYIIYAGQVIKLTSYEDEIPSKSGYTGQTVVESKSKFKSKPKTKTKSVPKVSTTSFGKNSKNVQHPVAETKNETASIASIKWQWPAKGQIIQSFSSSSVGKKGIQIAGNVGDPITAAAEGHVVYSGNSLVGYGNLVIVKHNEIYLTAYAHNRRVLVNEGERVTQGQTIAEMGASGTDRNKLHFEIRKDGQPVNPISYLPKR